MTPAELKSAIEAIIFASGSPVELADLAEVFPETPKDEITERLEDIRRQFDEGAGGFRLEQTGGGFRFVTSPELDPYLRKFFARKSEGRLSMAALETLAIVAYRQPVTAPEISDIRSVNSSGVLRTLLERRLVRIAGRKNVVGSPFLYRTTREFLTHFGLNDLEDLPKLEEFAEVLGENLTEDFLSAVSTDYTGEGTETTTDVEDTGQHVDVIEGESGDLSFEVRSDETEESTAGSESSPVEIESEAPMIESESTEDTDPESVIDLIQEELREESYVDDRETVESPLNKDE